MSQYLDKDGASRIAENFLSKQAEQDAILQNLQFDLKEAEHALVKTIQGPAPLNIRALTRPFDDYLISGNTVQDGTPTPSDPVDVVGCGVRTGNVMPAGEQKTVEDNGIVFSSDGKGKYVVSGKATANATAQFNLLTAFTTPISVSSSGRGTLSFFNTQSHNNVTFAFYNGATMVDDWRQTPIRRASTEYTIVGNKYVDSVKITVKSGVTVDMTITPEFTNNGVLPTSFENYGYKLPITVNNTEYPIYLGNVPTTRRIRKLVLDGTEDWVLSPTGFYYNLALSDNPRERDVVMSTHFTATHEGSLPVGTFRFAGSIASPINPLVFNYDSGTIGLGAFKSWLASQYANGTPVIVWFVPTTFTTEAVNEPLMKIGDYADTISMAQAGVEISTTKGFNTITTDTTVLPSNIEVKGVINNA